MITVDSILVAMAAVVSVVAFFGACRKIEKSINEKHDNQQKWDGYEQSIKQIKEEQYIITECMVGVLDGLHQLNCNGKVTESREKLDNYLNKRAHI
ncbi:MAG: hypothetical protein MSG78_11530 [Clostridiales bacterium]|nr:hypothetical protein [Clostridiales bacterium]